MARTPQGHDNRNAVLREILLSEPVTRKEIASRLGLTDATASRQASLLIDAGLVKETMAGPGDGPARRGPQPRPLSIDPSGGQVLGIGVAHTVQVVTLSDIGRNPIASSELHLEPVQDADRVVRELAKESRRLIGAHIQDRSRLLGGFLMISGTVHPTTGDILQAPYLGWESFPIRARFADLLNLPMKVRMLTETIARAESLFGEARDRGNVLALLCGIGIGAAVLVDGNPAGGGNVGTGSIGTTTVTGEDGVSRTLDEVAAGAAILHAIHGGGIARDPPWQLDLVLAEAVGRDRAGDRQVAAIMNRAGRELGRVVAQYMNFLPPEMVLVGGPLAMAPNYIGGLRETVAETVRAPVDIRTSGVVDPESAMWTLCSMAVYEHLLAPPPPPSSLTR